MNPNANLIHFPSTSSLGQGQAEKDHGIPKLRKKKKKSKDDAFGENRDVTIYKDLGNLAIPRPQITPESKFTASMQTLKRIKENK